MKVANAYGAPSNFVYCTQMVGTPGATSIVLGQIQSGNQTFLRVKDVSFSGPNAARLDIWVHSSSSSLVVEGTNTGTKADGGLNVY